MAERTFQLSLANYDALPLQDYVPCIRGSILASWQSRWNQCITDDNKLAQLKPPLGPWSSCSQGCRRLEVSLSLLVIVHTSLSHGHLMAREASPVWGRCQVRLSVFHVLVELPAYYVPRNRVFPTLTPVPPRECLSLLFSESPTFKLFDAFCIFECQASFRIFNMATCSASI